MKSAFIRSTCETHVRELRRLTTSRFALRASLCASAAPIFACGSPLRPLYFL